jgi:predicted tellurium resistance membrane protein TerC
LGRRPHRGGSAPSGDRADRSHFRRRHQLIEQLADPQVWIALLTLLALEVVLGIDNVIFISILAGRLPHGQQRRARTTGLALAVLSRIALLFSLSWVIGLTAPLFSLGDHAVSGRDLILVGGGMFLIAKSTFEIHHKLEGKATHEMTPAAPSLRSVLVQIMVLDVVFSLDSVITAVGMVDQLWIMITAVLLAAAVMIASAQAIGEFVDRHPTVKMLALAFLLLIGFTLIVEGMHRHIPKGYIYFAMAFSVMVEMLNLRLRSLSADPVKLRTP